MGSLHGRAGLGHRFESLEAEEGQLMTRALERTAPLWQREKRRRDGLMGQRRAATPGCALTVSAGERKLLLRHQLNERRQRD